MAKTTADVLFERLLAWGVDVIFGLPGDAINGFMEVLRTRRGVPLGVSSSFRARMMN